MLHDVDRNRHHTELNALSRYYSGVGEALSRAEARRRAAPATERFAPAFALPPLTDELRRYFRSSALRLGQMGAHGGKTLWLMDLMGNQATRTTKTFGSLVIVGRAIQHIRETGERMMVITPSAANKATALRDAALKAFEADLVTPDELQVAVVVPTSASNKLWMSALATDPDLKARNPVFMYAGTERETVKPITQQFVAQHSRRLLHEHGIRLWDSLHVDNYKVADVVRAFFEHDVFGGAEASRRLHVHAVSSAYGFLGHDLGKQLLAEASDHVGDSSYLVVQHLETPDVVLDVHFGRVDLDDLPRFSLDAVSGRYSQEQSPWFPATTLDVGERLEPTFYTRRPPTLPAIRELMQRAGGSGMVVSLQECLERYAQVRALLAAGGMDRLPADPRKLREWALVMAMVGALNAIDRGLVREEEIVIHGSGCYSEDEFTAYPEHMARIVEGPSDMEDDVYAATALSSSPRGS